MKRMINHVKFKENEGKLSDEAKVIYCYIADQVLNRNVVSIPISRDSVLLGDKTKECLDELEKYEIITKYSTRTEVQEDCTMYIFEIV
ncbi:MAG: hypothetical protein AB1414_03560 [bacterium]